MQGAGSGHDDREDDQAGGEPAGGFGLGEGCAGVWRWGWGRDWGGKGDAWVWFEGRAGDAMRCDRKGIRAILKDS